jgi:excisionase family DNA binding protein
MLLSPALYDEVKTVVREALREELAALRLPPGPDRSLLNVEAAAQRLGLKPATVYKRARRGDLPSVGLGSRVLFRASDLDAYVEARRRSPERVRALASGQGP